jgi:hypothetical protein
MNKQDGQLIAQAATPALLFFGAVECPAQVISIGQALDAPQLARLQQYSLPTDGSADATDPDGDGLKTWQEWRCQTDPTNALSVLRLLSASPAGTDVTVS